MPQSTVEVQPEGKCKDCIYLTVKTFWKKGRGYEFTEYYVCDLGRYYRDCKSKRVRR